MWENNKEVNLKSVYLYLYILEKLLRYQFVQFKGKNYLKRFRLSLNAAAANIIAAAIKTAGKDAKIKEAIDPYIDDIMIDVTKAFVENVVDNSKNLDR